MIIVKVNNVVLFVFSMTWRWGVVEKKLDLDFTYILLMTRILSVSFLSFFPSLFSSLSLMDENSATDCSPVQRSFAISNELSVRFHVSVTVHSNRQSSLHPPPSGASFVNAQSPPRQENYRARRIGSSFSRLAERSLLAEINLMLRVTIVMIFFRIFPSDLIKIYILLRQKFQRKWLKYYITEEQSYIF